MSLLFALHSSFHEKGNIVHRKLVVENISPAVLREIMFCSVSIDNYKNKHILKNVLNISSTEIQLYLHICQYTISIHITIYLLS